MFTSVTMAAVPVATVYPVLAATYVHVL